MENVSGSAGLEVKAEIDREIPKSSIKLWNPIGLLALSIFFSFLPGAILYSLNYKRVGNDIKYRYSLVISIVGFLVLFLLVSLVDQGITKSIFLGVNIAAGMFMNLDQSKMFEAHIVSGGRKASFLIPTIVCTVVTAIILGLIIYSSHVPDQKLMYKGSELYYTDNVQKNEAEKLGAYLSKQGFFSDNKISVKIDKDGATYKFSLIVDESLLSDKTLEQSVKEMAKELSVNVFNNSKVDIIFCNDAFKPLKTISG